MVLMESGCRLALVAWIETLCGARTWVPLRHPRRVGACWGRSVGVVADPPPSGLAEMVAAPDFLLTLDSARGAT